MFVCELPVQTVYLFFFFSLFLLFCFILFYFVLIYRNSFNIREIAPYLQNKWKYSFPICLLTFLMFPYVAMQKFISM